MDGLRRLAELNRVRNLNGTDTTSIAQ